MEVTRLALCVGQGSRSAPGRREGVLGAFPASFLGDLASIRSPAAQGSQDQWCRLAKVRRRATVPRWPRAERGPSWGLQRSFGPAADRVDTLAGLKTVHSNGTDVLPVLWSLEIPSPGDLFQEAPRQSTDPQGR